MHRTDGANHASNLFVDRDLVAPTPGTQIEKHWLNAVQEEIVGVILDAGIALVKGTNTQLLSALRASFVRVSGTASQTVTGIKTFTSRMIINLLLNGNSALHVTNTGNGEAVEADNNGATPTTDFTNSGVGAALKLNVQNARYHAMLTPVATIPTNGPDGNPLDADDAGAMVYVAGALNKLYVWDGAAWNACW